MNEPEYEHTYYADNSHDKLAYVLVLWEWTKEHYGWETGRRAEVQGEQGLEQGAGCESSRVSRDEQAGQPVQHEEAWGWQSWSGPEGLVTTTRTGESISERVLRATGTQASDWTEGYGTRPGQSQAEGDTKRSGALALLRVLEILQGDGEQGIFSHHSGLDINSLIEYNLKYALYPRGVK